MKKTFLSIALLLAAGTPSAMAQVSRINPIPQQCSQQGELFDLPAQWRVVCSKALESSIARQALNLISVKENAKAPFTVTLVLANEKAGRKAGKPLAKKAEAYSLQVSEKGINHEKDVLGCDGYNVVQNNGEAAGQTVFHFHMHLIPRYEGEAQIVAWAPPSRPTTPVGPRMKPVSRGTMMARIAGTTISCRAPLVHRSTQAE